MNRKTKLLLAALGILFVLPGMMSAQAQTYPKYFHLSYWPEEELQDELLDKEALGYNGAGKVGGAVLFTEDMIAEYKDDKVEVIRIALCEAVSRLKVFVSYDLEADPIVAAEVQGLHKGWNEIVLPEAYKIADKAFYIGVEYDSPSPSGDSYFRPLRTQSGMERPNSCFLRSPGGGWIDMVATAGYGPLRLEAGLSGNTAHFANKAYPFFSSVTKYIQRGLGIYMQTLLFNEGYNPIETVEVEYSVPGEAPRLIEKAFTPAIAAYHGGMLRLGLSLKPKQNGELKLRFTKINGMVPNKTKDAVSPIYIYSPAGVTERTHLVETFTSESTKFVPTLQGYIDKGIEMYKKDVPNAKKIIEINHHINDKFSTPETQEGLSLFLKQNQAITIPAIMLNREVDENSKERTPVNAVQGALFVKILLRHADNAPGFVTIGASAHVEGNDAIIDATIEKLPDTPQGPYYISVAMTESNIESTTQYGANGPFVHNNVLRKMATSYKGEAFSFDAAGKASRRFRMALDPSWIRTNLQPVVFVHAKYNPPTESLIYNSAAPVLSGADRSERIAAEGTELKIYAAEGALQIEGDYLSAAVYTMNGALVSRHDLAPGVYMVVAQTRQGSVTAKVFVR